MKLTDQSLHFSQVLRFLWAAGLVFAAFLHLSLSVIQYYDEKYLYAGLLRREKYLALLLLLFGLGIFLLDRFCAKKLSAGAFSIFSAPEVWLLGAFALWCLISAAVTACSGAFSWREMDSWLYDVFFCVFLFLPLAAWLGEKGGTLALKLVLAVFVSGMTALMLLVLFRLYSGQTPFSIPGGQVGLDTELRLRLNCHGNTTGAYALSLFFECLYLALDKNRVFRVLFGAASLVHLAVLLLSNSRTALLALLVSLSVLLLVRALRCPRYASRVKRGAAAVLGIALLFGGVFALRAGLYSALERRTHAAEALASGSDIAAVMLTPEPVSVEEQAKSQELIAAREAESAGSRALNFNTNGRTEIWQLSLKLIFSDVRHALFGYMPSGVRSAIRAASSGAFNTYSHNQFLEIALAVGIPGLLLFLAWLLLLAWRCIQVLWYGSAQSSVLPLLLLSLVIANLTEAYLLFYHYLPGSIFFLVSGCVIHRTKK